jgi:hypothetical protein
LQCKHNYTNYDGGGDDGREHDEKDQSQRHDSAFRWCLIILGDGVRIGIQERRNAMISYPQAPNEAAEVSFRSWLRGVLADHVTVTEMASPLLWQQDWDSSLTVEVPAAKTKSGKTESFHFRDLDMIPDFEEIAYAYVDAA